MLQIYNTSIRNITNQNISTRLASEKQISKTVLFEVTIDVKDANTSKAKNINVFAYVLLSPNANFYFDLSCT